jgi:hypothetical protein
MDENKDVSNVKVGSHVVVVDSTAKHHDALVTAIHGHMTKEAREKDVRSQMEKPDSYYAANTERAELFINGPHMIPSINAVYVTDDESKTDPYGRQIERKMTSVPHRSTQTAHGYYWYAK